MYLFKNGLHSTKKLSFSATKSLLELKRGLTIIPISTSSNVLSLKLVYNLDEFVI